MSEELGIRVCRQALNAVWYTQYMYMAMDDRWEWRMLRLQVCEQGLVGLCSRLFS